VPIHDEAHVRNALARFDRVAFEDDAAEEWARGRFVDGPSGPPGRRST
jgi:hypothetical protein